MMQTGRFEAIEDVFHKARLLDPPSRAGYLDEACGDDLDLRAEVESLLAHSENKTERIDLSPSGEGFRAVFVDRSPEQAEEDGETLVERGPPAEGPGTRIGSYKILQEIGEGGFGVVYMAEQQEPVRRKVALKIIKLGMDTKQVIARFEAERQALALMDHPNIAKVLEAGATETGRPYFVMELVKGIPIVQYCDTNKLTTRERIDLFLQVCSAVQHAHQKGIIHRDLKPSNVLVTLHDAKPVPMVIDFGIAKATSQRLTEKTLFTEFRQLIGTPEYMSPDQAEISGLDVDTRSDIYSLGVILYELLTGTTPFDAETLRKAAYGEIQRIIREVEPPKPSTRMETLATQGSGQAIARHRQAEPAALSRIIRGDLDWIVMKAMEKDRTRRYQTAGEMAADLRRYLASEPVAAGPPSVVYKVRKFVRRHHVGVVATVLIVAAVIFGLASATYGLIEARQEAQRNQRIADFLQDLLVSTSPEDAIGQDADVERVIETAREIFGDDHATVAATLRSRALQLQSAGDLEAAEELFNRSLEIWRSVGDEANVAATMNRIGLLLMTKGDDLGSEEAFREAVRIYRERPAAESLALCEPLMQLASVLINRSEFEEAADLLEESIELRRRVAPHQRLQIAISYASLTNVHALEGDLDQLVETTRKSVEAWRAALPAGGVLLARVLTEYAVVYLRTDDFAAAEDLARESLELFKQVDSSAALHRELALKVLYEAIMARNEFDDAGVQTRLAFLDDLRAVAGDDEKVLAGVLPKVINDFRSHGRPAEVVDLAREVVAIARQVDPDSLDDAVRDLGNLAWDIAKEPNREAREYELALAAIKEVLTEQPESRAFINTLGVVQYRLGMNEEALETHARSDALYSEEFPTGVPADLAFMAMAHYKLGNADEARALLNRLREAMRDPRNAGSPEARQFSAEAEALLEGADDHAEKNDDGD
jgi:serine/threonine protein kinase/tetratricopeptide (TPR) repeat protein